MITVNPEFSISIVIPAHELSSELKACLHSVKENRDFVKEVIVILDGLMIDDSFFEPFTQEEFIIEELSTNRGPAFARNHGAKLASGEILFFMDSDVILKRDTLKMLSEHFYTTDGAEALIGSYDNDPFDTSLVSKFRNLLHHYTHQMANESATTFWGACGAIKKDVFLAVGGFDTSFEKASVEDIELGYRLLQHGYKIKLNSQLQVKHLKRWSLLNVMRTDIFYRARPWTQLLHAYRKLEVNDLNVSYKERLSVVLLMMGILGLAMSIQYVVFLPVSMVIFLTLTGTQWNTYRFFSKHFEWYQLPWIILLHWNYLSCATIGFILGSADVLFSKERLKPAISRPEKLAHNE